MRYFMCDLGDQKFVIMERHGVYANHFKAVTQVIEGATFASEILSEFVNNKGFATMNSLARYVMRK
jgi:hypothetical protein